MSLLELAHDLDSVSKACKLMGYSRQQFYESGRSRTASSSASTALLDEHFRVEGRETWFETVKEMQLVLDTYLVTYNERRPHQGRGMKGSNPTTVFVEGLLITSGAANAGEPEPKPASTPKRKEKAKPETEPQTTAN